MGEKTAIEWTNATWNPLTGCTRVTMGCDHCYAFALHDMRYQAFLAGKSMPVQYHKPFSEVQLLPGRLEQPLKVRKPQMYFVNSMSDLFHSEVPDEYIRQVFEIMRRADWHTFQVLTKRVGRLRRLGKALDWPGNVWAGVSLETDDLVGRVDALREVPAAIRFLSCEPLLGPLPSLNLTGIDWVITGGESGPNARHCDADWVRGIRDLCVARGVPYFHKQWGGRNPKAGGRELDGEVWSEFPQKPFQFDAERPQACYPVQLELGG